MALRIAGKRMPPVQEEPLIDEEAQETPAEDTPEEESTEGGELDQETAGYKGPEQGPFECGHCEFYMADGSHTCKIVAGHIDEHGVCNVFSPMQDETPEEPAGQEEVPEEVQPMPGEMPEEG